MYQTKCLDLRPLHNLLRLARVSTFRSSSVVEQPTVNRKVIGSIPICGVLVVDPPQAMYVMHTCRWDAKNSINKLIICMSLGLTHANFLARWLNWHSSRLEIYHSERISRFDSLPRRYNTMPGIVNHPKIIEMLIDLFSCHG